jgi:hypothetical protein
MYLVKHLFLDRYSTWLLQITPSPLCCLTEKHRFDPLKSKSKYFVSMIFFRDINMCIKTTVIQEVKVMKSKD